MIRPHPAEWFELFVARDDAVLLLEDLARSGCVELEPRTAGADERAQELKRALARSDALAQRYGAYWPEAKMVARPSDLHRMVEQDVTVLETWSAAAAPLIESVRALEAERSSLTLWREVLAQIAGGAFDLAVLTAPGTAVECALFVLPGDAQLALPPAVLGKRLQLGADAGVLAIGAPEALAAGQIVLSRELERAGVHPPINVLASLSRLMKDGTGKGYTHPDHPALASQLFASYARAVQTRLLASVVGEEGLSDADRASLAFGDAVERELLSQDGARTFEESMQAGWTVLRRLPRTELTRLSDAQIDEHLTSVG